MTTTSNPAADKWTARLISRFETNLSTPLTCGHRHVTGATVYQRENQTICDYCHRTGAAA